MASTQGLKLRIRSVKSTKQITKAMQLVAASKMRRAQEATKASTPYTNAASEILASLSTHTASETHPLYQVRVVKKRLIILIASDKGLAGAYNSNVLKVYTGSNNRLTTFKTIGTVHRNRSNGVLVKMLSYFEYNTIDRERIVDRWE